MMHGSLIDSHHRSSLSSNGPGALSSSEHTLTDDEHTNKSSNVNHPIIPSTTINSKKAVICLGDVVEDDDEKEPTVPITHSADFFRWTHGHRHVMLTFCTICLFAFMTGVEYAVILPTAFEYVKTMTTADIYVGLILSFYSISGSIAGIIMGKISDMTGKVKILILVSTVFEIGGNILYFVSKDIHIVLLGRLIAGVGMGAVPPVSCFHMYEKSICLIYKIDSC
jgi:Na+/melibiose symporter-like transporter